MSKRRTEPSTLQAMISALRTTTEVTLSCQGGRKLIVAVVGFSKAYNQSVHAVPSRKKGRSTLEDSIVSSDNSIETHGGEEGEGA
eukprot:scaffold241046_cov16-Tisochrysis_lutea.AAC.2